MGTKSENQKLFCDITFVEVSYQLGLFEEEGASLLADRDPLTLTNSGALFTISLFCIEAAIIEFLALTLLI